MTDNKHKLVPMACKYRRGKNECCLPYPFMVCPYYQDGTYKKDKHGNLHYEKSTCKACREDKEKQ